MIWEGDCWDLVTHLSCPPSGDALWSCFVSGALSLVWMNFFTCSLWAQGIGVGNGCKEQKQSCSRRVEGKLWTSNYKAKALLEEVWFWAKDFRNWGQSLPNTKETLSHSKWFYVDSWHLPGQGSCFQCLLAPSSTDRGCRLLNFQYNKLCFYISCSPL